MVTISYAVSVCNEHEELARLLTQLESIKRDDDEIVVQCDKGNTTPEVYVVLADHVNNIRIVEFSLNKDFAAFKNNLKANCSKDFIFFIDADEYLSENLMLIPEVLELNPEIDLYRLPRINTVAGLTEEHIKKWGWRVSPEGLINYPDFQSRVVRYIASISWYGKVHETLQHTKRSCELPDFDLIHPKTIEKQEKQNNLYAKI